MKKALAVILLISICILPSFAVDGELWFTPIMGAYGIPMDSVAFTSHPDSNGNFDWAGFSNDGTPADGYFSYFQYQQRHGSYSDFNIVCSGGINLGRSYSDPVKIILEFNANMEFLSAAYTAQGRPYELWLVGRYQGEKNHTTLITQKIESGKEIVLEYPAWDRPDYATDQWNNPLIVSMWFDVVLVLPGDVTSQNLSSGSLADSNNTIKVSGGNPIYLVETNDYSSVVTVNMTVADGPENTKGKYSYVCAISGFYQKNNSVKGQDAVSVNVTPLPGASNIDLMHRTKGTIPVAMVNVLGTSSTPLYISLSSQRNPFTGNQPTEEARLFRLLHNNYLATSSGINVRNSVTYRAKLEDLNTGKVYDFDGTQLIDPNSSSLSSLYSSDQVARTTSVVGQNKGNAKRFEIFNGEIRIELDPHEYVMIRGNYESIIYVHVLSE